ADEKRLFRQHAQLLERQPVDPRVRLADADGGGEYDGIEQPAEGRLLPQLAHVAGAVADQPEAETARPELYERLHGAVDRDECPSRYALADLRRTCRYRRV